MEPLRCLIVDDEPPALEVLRSYLAAVDSLRLVGACSNALEAFQVLQRQEIDLLFLDIEMPRLSGVELMKSLKYPPQVIFTTASREYAVEGFDLDAADYLLKPFSLDRFLRAVDKVLSGRAERAASPAGTHNEQRAFLYFRADRKMVKVFLDEILYAESLKDYVRIVTQHDQTVTKLALTALETMLPEPDFQRIHRSYLVALDKVTSYSAQHVALDGKELPIGRLYRHEVESALTGPRP